MTPRVFDASALVSALVDSGPEGEWAGGLLADCEPWAPHLAPVEAANILRRLEQREKITPAEAGSAFADLRQLPLVLAPFAPIAERVWALRGRLTAYDATYVALAETLGAQLVTLDRRIARAGGLGCDVRVPPER